MPEKQPKNVQLARCVRRVAEEHGGDVRRAFAICTASLRRGGYVAPGTNRPTFLGYLRAAEMEGEAGHAAGIDAYEHLLAGARATTRRQRARRTRRERGPKRCPSAKPLPLPTTARRGGSPRPSASGPRGSRKTMSPALAKQQVHLRPPTSLADARQRLQPLRHALDQVFSCSTAYGDCHPDHPSAGHCFLASMMVQDEIGGCIVTAEVRRTPHYWVRVNGIDVDVTGDQFDKPAVQVKRGKLYRGAKVFGRHPRERLDQKVNRTAMRLYDKLRKKVVPVLRRQGDGEIADQIAAMR